MNVRNAVLLSFATAVVCGLVWALHSFAHTRSWESFAVMCVMMLIIIIAIARYTPVDKQQ
jgi:ABC-type phosphate/phosphonate transport system permease subunit